jgi:carboxyl-terminal processing protease
MRGEAGTSIRLTIFRPGRDEPFDVTVVRGVISLDPVTSKLENGIGVISVNEFSRNVGNQVNAAIQKMKQDSGGKLSGLVLDLRSNPGGALDEAVALSDLPNRCSAAMPPGAFRWSCWSMRAAPRRPKSSPARCRTSTAR